MLPVPSKNYTCTSLSLFGFKTTPFLSSQTIPIKSTTRPHSFLFYFCWVERTYTLGTPSLLIPSITYAIPSRSRERHPIEARQRSSSRVKIERRPSPPPGTMLFLRLPCDFSCLPLIHTPPPLSPHSFQLSCSCHFHVTPFPPARLFLTRPSPYTFDQPLAVPEQSPITLSDFIIIHAPLLPCFASSASRFHSRHP